MKRRDLLKFFGLAVFISAIPQLPEVKSEDKAFTVKDYAPYAGHTATIWQDRHKEKHKARINLSVNVGDLPLHVREQILKEMGL